MEPSGIKVPLSINGPRLLGRLDTFAEIGKTACGGVNRQALTLEDRKARETLAKLAHLRGFEISQDAIANIFIARRGRKNTSAAILIGSHLDTQPTGGKFDGALGTLAAFEVLETLEDAGVETALPIEVVIWTNEEGSRFTPGSMGSQAYVAGEISHEIYSSISTEGVSLINELDATLKALPHAERRPLGGSPRGYLELHIEQGPLLEREGIPIGIVTGVQGVRWLEIKIIGEAGHAGTTLLTSRRDPMNAAIAALSELYATIMPKDMDARLTVGRMHVEPGSINSIPSAVTFTVDIRHPDISKLDAIEVNVSHRIVETTRITGCSVTIERLFDMPPTSFAESLLVCIEDAARAQGRESRRLISGAFHDALFISRIAPTAMIFVPCRDGVSHNEREFVEPEFSILGAETLLRSTLRATELLAKRGQGEAFG
ncbi:Zn-dependent hydrolase [Rhizobium rhizogenes]|uniref:Zn-dependent hydrolase n=1 Tax=Rhizobium rhizogenes TaxID=359 RepID=UPI001574DDA3|nr:Zn-dependent hydrolase [Rhizobium rhizogenes]NTI76591.1 Zn-dependent hydrolase [Rhizobium rhizogenes]